MKAADKLIAIALAVGSLLFLGSLVLRFFLPAPLPIWLGLNRCSAASGVAALFPKATSASAPRCCLCDDPVLPAFGSAALAGAPAVVELAFLPDRTRATALSDGISACYC